MIRHHANFIKFYLHNIYNVGEIVNFKSVVWSLRNDKLKLDWTRNHVQLDNNRLQFIKWNDKICNKNYIYSDRILISAFLQQVMVCICNLTDILTAENAFYAFSKVLLYRLQFIQWTDKICNKNYINSNRILICTFLHQIIGCICNFTDILIDENAFYRYKNKTTRFVTKITLTPIEFWFLPFYIEL